MTVRGAGGHFPVGRVPVGAAAWWWLLRHQPPSMMARIHEPRDELTSPIENLVGRIQQTATIDAIVASYAAEDARRFVSA